MVLFITHRCCVKATKHYLMNYTQKCCAMFGFCTHFK
uniref:Uncharacterized protein n=1 Tax=Anguilla anguilla TaxID=7936 RepID=A0A0E9V4H9_ANGAN